MKCPDRNTVSQLDEVPDIGKAISKKLQLIGIEHPKDLIGKDPFALYTELCIRSDKRIDPCVIDVFMSAIYFMEHGVALPWWEFTDERKQHIAQQSQRSESK